MRYALYARKSTQDREDRQVQSIEDQLKHGQRTALEGNLHIVTTITEARSAKEPYKLTRSGQRLPARLGFERMISQVESGEIDGLIAWHPDRLSRNEMDAATITHLLRTGKLKDLQFCNYSFTNSPEGIMMLQMALSQSQYSSSKLSVDVLRGMRSKIEKGWYPHKAPPGYLNDKHKEKGQKTISPDPERFATIRQAWELALTGAYSITDILQILNERWNYRSRVTKSGGGEPMAKTTLYRLFSNVFYAGYFTQKGVLYQGQHAAMVTMEEFARVQQLLGTTGVTKSYKREFAYTGMIRCATCKSQITAQVNTKPSGRTYTYYHCTNSHGGCSKRSISERALEAAINEVLTEITVLPIFQEWAWEAYEEWKETTRAAQQETYGRSLRSLEDVDRYLDNLLDMKMKGLITDGEYGHKKQQLVIEREALSRITHDIEAQADKARQAMENTLEFMKNAATWFNLGTVEMKRAVLWSLGSNFVLDDKKLLLELHPLLAPIKNEYKTLETKYLEIKPLESSSYREEQACLEPIRSVWSRLWHQNLNSIAQEQLYFPKMTNGQFLRVGNLRA
ncbi:MAG: recombinase family protein [Abitibacteriaceae bacterium]|nr:recombinase family protein [Abditibacteriaceae bacterium]